MSCTTIAKNGKVSILADTLKAVLGEENGIKLYNKTRSYAFANRMSGSAFVDKNNEAVPMFYADKHSLNNATFKDRFNKSESRIFLTDDYTMAMRGATGQEVVFVNSPLVKQFKGKVIPNVDYLKSHSKGIYGHQNTISINSNDEVIVFDSSHILDINSMDAARQPHEQVTKLNGFLNTYTKEETHNVVAAEKLTRNLAKNNITRITVDHDGKQDDPLTIDVGRSMSAITINFNKYGTRVFAHNDNILTDLLNNTVSDEYKYFTDALDYSDSPFVQTLLDRFKTISTTKTLDELAVSLLASAAYIENNKDNPNAVNEIKKLKTIIEDAGLTNIVNYHSAKIFGALEKVFIPNKSTTDSLNVVGVVESFSDYRDLHQAARIESNIDSEVNDSKIVNFKVNILKSLKFQLQQQETLLYRYQNKAMFNAMAEDDVQERKRVISELRRKIIDLEFGINRKKTIYALKANHIVDLHNIDLAENFLKDLDLTATSDLTRAEELEFAFKANAVREVLASMTPIGDLTKLENTLITAGSEDFTTDEILDINKEIADIRKMNDRIIEAKKDYARQEDKINQYIVKDIPEVEARLAMTQLIYGIKDINSAQYWLDSLMDVDNSLAASFKKRRSDMLFEKEVEARQRIYRNNNKLAKLLGSAWNTKEGREAYMNDITDDEGKLHQIYSAVVYGERDERRAKLGLIKKNNDKIAYMNAKREYDEWVAKNFEGDRTDEFNEIFYSLPSDVKNKLNGFMIERQLINEEVLIDNNGVIKPEYFTDDQKMRYDELQSRVREFYKELNEDEAMTETLDKINDLYDNFDSSEYTKAYSEKLKETDYVEAAAWYMRNGKPSDEFKAEEQARHDIIQEGGKSNSSYHRFLAKELLNEILNKYKDRDGLYDMNKLSASEKDDVAVLSYFIKAKSRGPVDKIHFDDLTIAKVRNNIKRHGHKFVFKRKPITDKMISNAKTEEKAELFKAMQWLSDNTEDAPTDYYLNAKKDAQAQGDEAYRQWILENHTIAGYGNGTELIQQSRNKQKQAERDNNRKSLDALSTEELEIKAIPNEGWLNNIPKDLTGDNISGKSHFNSTRAIKDKYVNENVELDADGYGKPREQWRSNKYNSLSDGQKETINYINETMSELTSHLQDSIYRFGYIPAIESSTSGTVEEREDLKTRIAKDTSGDKIFNIPFKGLHLLNQTETISIREQGESELDEDYLNFIKLYIKNQYDIAIPTTKEELRAYKNSNANINKMYQDTLGHATKDEGGLIDTLIEPVTYSELHYMQEFVYTYNEAIKKDNVKKHKDSLSMDIKDSMEEFIESATNNKYKVDLEGEARLGMAVFKNAKYKETKSTFDAIANAYKDKLSTNKDEDATSNKDSLLYERYAKDMEMVFYERFLEDNKHNDLLRNIKEYVSVAGIGFNIFSAIKNVGYGGLMMDNEAQAGFFYNRKNLRIGTAQYLSTLNDMISDLNKGVETELTSKAMAALIHYNIVDTQTENEYRSAKRKKGDHNLKIKAHWVKDKLSFLAFTMQERGESFMQNSALLAMMDSHRLVDGNIMSLEDYIGTKLEVYTVAEMHKARKEGRSEEFAAKADAISKNNKAEVKRLTEEFETNDTVMSRGEIVDNEFIVTGAKEGEDSSFRTKVQGVNQKTHGIYNQSDKGPIENTMNGQLAMQYRHWLRPGWVKRYGSRGMFKGNKFYNVRRKEYDMGSWKTVGKFLRSPLTDGGLEVFLDGKDSTLANKAVAITKAYSDFIIHAKRYWNVLDRQQKKDVNRAMHELIVAGVVIGLLLGLKKMGDDDKKKNGLVYNSLVYLLSALSTETVGFLPIYSWFGQVQQLLTNPVAAFSQLEKTGDLMLSVLSYPFLSPQKTMYQNGKYKGESKIGIKLGKLIPLYNQLQRFMFINKNDKYYKSQFFNL